MTGLESEVAAVRGFNRFYTSRIGVLGDRYLGSPFSLTEGRVLYELASRDRPTAAQLARDLDLDAGYLSRILRNFEQKGLLRKTRSAADGRESLLALTDEGRAAFAPLDQRSRDIVAALLSGLPSDRRARLIDSLSEVQAILGSPGDAPRAPYVLRPPGPGDMGWIVQRHGALYAAEYGWGTSFEALVADVVATFMRNFDARKDCCWIAERDGENVGSALVVRETDTVARFRMLLVEPSARGLGIGARLVEECIRFARRAGYRKMVLWTHEVLTAARQIYQKAGFRLVESKPHDDFGETVIGETWEIEL
ncbi:MAG TPA: helix-turn-helix domain-containing GNAT family N-acetyltransferase [Alphaproteobacteria bacterium]|nr:helix-turn-helix domain-containing GNAT family N-acetyltransferase [Alphaproteobacteria bacterium]